MPLPYRWLTSLMVRYNGSSLLVDCGEGTQIAIKEKGWSFKPIDVICFTHYHGDHISGLPGCFSLWEMRTVPTAYTNRTERTGTSGECTARDRTGTAISRLNIWKSQEAEQTFEMNGYRLRAFRVNHNVTCYGYTMEIDRAGKFDVERAKASKIPQEYWGTSTKR